LKEAVSSETDNIMTKMLNGTETSKERRLPAFLSSDFKVFNLYHPSATESQGSISFSGVFDEM
jgi:hypothetical protein